MEREAFLERVRSAVGSAELPEAPFLDPGGPLPGLPTDDLTDRFVERLEAVAGVAHRVTGDDEAIRVMAELLNQYEASEYLAWDADQLPVPGLKQRLPGRMVDPEVSADAAGRLAHQTGYADLRAGITGTSGALADSGSIVLDCGPGRSRMASLIPLAHVALLRPVDIAPGLSHWIAAHPRAAADTSNLVVITGPSRTADIEQILNLGVHGPKHVHVIVLDY